MQEAQGTLSFTELIFNASFLVQLVMLFLLILSLLSWTIIIQRTNQYKIAKVKANDFEDKFWSGIDLNNLYQDCIKRQDSLIGLEVIYAAGFKEFVRLVNSGPADQEVVMDGTYRQMKVATSREVEALESHLPTLATIGSISPYIGLFGTVWGIMHAFVALAAVKNATLSMVAPPIAEALIATAMGLFAAIPAVMFYNRFVTKVEALENIYLNFMDEFSTILNRRLVTIRSQINKNETKAQPKGQDRAYSNQQAQAVAKEIDDNVQMQRSNTYQKVENERFDSQRFAKQNTQIHTANKVSSFASEHDLKSPSSLQYQTPFSRANENTTKVSVSSYNAPLNISSISNPTDKAYTHAKNQDTQGSNTSSIHIPSSLNINSQRDNGGVKNTVRVDFENGSIRPTRQGYVNSKDPSAINNVSLREPNYITPGVRNR